MITHFDDDIEEPLVPQKIDYKAKDALLFNQWNETKSKRDMSTLVNHLSPLIYREVSRAAGTLPLSALNAEGKNWTIKAIKTFDPEKGFALSTHVTNYLQRVRRMNYKYQHAARLPENMKREFHKYNSSLSQLSEELNRDPSEEEMAAHLGWSKGTVIKFKKSVYSDLLESEGDKPSEVVEYSDTNLLMNNMMTHLTEDEKFILRNKGKLSATELALKLGVNNNRLNYLQNKLIVKIKKIQSETSM
jgi:RNA polymerase sigma factor (sigma-70 family)